MGTLVGIAVCVGNRRAVATAPAEVEPTGIMTFADPAVQALCAKTWGDGTNITYEQAREVTEIPKNWAKDNKTITSFNEIKYFKNLLYIRERAFTNCSNLVINEISLPNLLLIELSAFANCTVLGCELLNLPSCETLGTTVFYNTTIKRVVMPKLKTIADSQKDYGCFQKIPNLESVTLRDIEYIGDYSFKDATKLVLDSIEYPNLTRIGISAFAGCTFTLNKAILPNCKKIGASAFYGCSSMALTSLELPQCTSIGNSAFESCSSMALTSLELPQCTTIGNVAFYGCSSMALTSLELPNCTRIGDSAFESCSSMALTSLELPLCTSIGNGAFYGCSSMALTSLELPQCASIGNGAFNGCSSMALTSLELPQCTTIGSECFAYTKGIGKLNWGELAKNVIYEGFRNITGIGIPIVNIPNITAWFESTFGYINASPAIYSHNLCQNDVPMPDVVIPEGCTKVGQKTLCYLHLNSLSIPETVTSIGDYNQYALQLPVFDIPSSVTKIGQYVIGGNNDSNVKNVPIVICRAVTPPTLGTVKANGGAHQAIYVPDESVEAYKTATNWSAFADIILPLSQYKE